MTYKEHIKAIRAREAAATAVPWGVMDDTDDFTGIYVEALSHPKGHQQLICKEQHHCGENQDGDNMEFIAHARADIPFLLSRVSELEAALGDAILTMRDDIDVITRLNAIKDGNAPT